MAKRVGVTAATEMLRTLLVFPRVHQSMRELVHDNLTEKGLIKTSDRNRDRSRPPACKRPRRVVTFLRAEDDRVVPARRIERDIKSQRVRISQGSPRLALLVV